MSDMTQLPQYEMNMRDYVRILFRQKAVILVAFITVLLTAFVGVNMKTPMYEASVKLLVSGTKQAEAPYYKDLMGIQQAQVNLTQSQIAISDPVLQRTVAALHLYRKPPDYEAQFASPVKFLFIKLNAKMMRARMAAMSDQERALFSVRRAIAELRNNVSSEPIKDTNMFVIKVRDYDRIGAPVVANVLSRSYVIFDMEQQVAELQLKYGAKHPMVLQLGDTIKNMTQNLSGKMLSNAEAIGPASVKIIEQASLPLRPIGAGNGIILLAAMFGGLFLGIILAFIFDYADQAIKSPREMEMLLSLTMLGYIPKTRLPKDLIIDGKINKKTNRDFVGAYQDLCNQLLLLRTTKTFKTIYLATSDDPQGESLVAANLAIQLAEHASKKVLIIDANFRHPSLHKVFKLQQVPGLVDVLLGTKKTDDVLRQINHNLTILPAGQTHLNPVTFLNSVQMLAALESLKHQFDMVLLCCSELKSYQDGYLLASVVDQTIFIVTENRTRKHVAAMELATLREHKVQILGGVLNERTFPIPDFVYKRV